MFDVRITEKHTSSPNHSSDGVSSSSFSRLGQGSESSASDLAAFLATTIGTVFGKASVAKPIRKF
jgi:hypothetical protein